MRSVFFILITIVFPIRAEDPKPLPPSQPSPVGLWLGTLKLGETELRVVFHIEDKMEKAVNFKGKLISLDQNRIEVPCETVTFNHKDRQIILDIPKVAAKFTGTMDETEKKITGEFTQADRVTPLVLEKIEKLPEAKRPQAPKPPFPYESQGVTFPNAGANIELAGTLTLPKGNGPFPAVVLVSGSGPQDRDETLFEHKPFLVIADHLTRAGIAVLRYDDRGFGKSGGKFAGSTSADFASDAFAAVTFLRTRKEIDSKNIGICGHSEGGMIGPMVAAEHPDEIAFLVLLAGPGILCGEILKQQNLDVLRNAKAGKEHQQLLSNFFDAALPLITSDRSKDDLQKALDELADGLVMKWKNEAEREPIRKHLAALTTAFGDPWMRYFLAFDPAVHLKMVKCPVFALNGEKDVQVRAKPNLAAISAALQSNERVTVKEFPGLNHLFQTCKTGAVMEYGSIEETFNIDVMKAVKDWIKGLK